MGEAVTSHLKKKPKKNLTGPLAFALALFLAGAVVVLLSLSYRWYIAGFDSESSRMILAGLGFAVVFCGFIISAVLSLFGFARNGKGRFWAAAGFAISALSASILIVLALL